MATLLAQEHIGKPTHLTLQLHPTEGSGFATSHIVTAHNTDDIDFQTFKNVTQVSQSTSTNVPRHEQGKYTTLQCKQAEQVIVG
jgi:hypothetical protein